MTRSLNSFSYGEETFEVYASSRGTDLSDFRLVYKGSAPSEWTKTSVDLPEGTMYFAIKCTSVDRFVMGLDDITYIPGTGMPKDFELTGYNFYRNSKKVNESIIDGRNFSCPGSIDDRFAVTAVYTTGESRFSNVVVPSGVSGLTYEDGIAVTVSDGIISVLGAEGRPVRIFTADGILNFSGYGDCSHAVTPGVYIVKAGDTVVKIFVR